MARITFFSDLIDPTRFSSTLFVDALDHCYPKVSRIFDGAEGRPTRIELADSVRDNLRSIFDWRLEDLVRAGHARKTPAGLSIKVSRSFDVLLDSEPDICLTLLGQADIRVISRKVPFSSEWDCNVDLTIGMCSDVPHFYEGARQGNLAAGLFS